MKKKETKMNTRSHISLLSWLSGSACGKHQSRNRRLSGRKTTAILLLDCQLGGITNFQAHLWGSFYIVLIEVDKLTLNVGTLLPELGSSNKKASWAPTFISLLAEYGFNVNHCFMFLPCHLLGETILNLWVQTHPSFGRVLALQQQERFHTSC